MWNDLLKLGSATTEPWLLASDFNATINRDDRKGGALRRQGGCKVFKEFIRKSGLLDLGFIGPRFTWQRGRLMIRLDRDLYNNEWILAFYIYQKYKVTIARVCNNEEGLASNIEDFTSEAQI